MGDKQRILMNQEPFIITGLPRSRTAWLAQAATIDGWSHCGHEPVLDWQGLEALAAYLQSRDDRYVGVSDSHLAQVLPDILSAFPIRTLIVLRDPNEVAASLDSLGLNPHRIIPLSQAGIATVLDNPLVKTIEYADLSNSRKVRKALQWLMPDAPIDTKRIQSLQAEHIVVDHIANRDRWFNDRRNTNGIHSRA